ncbi:MFS transporter [Streptomyces sp. NPDC002734]|uniref:MFS transporter n=1 Tax=Streptomyces sp. NPDC002734 TaxID=3154426 RepID=UPI00332A724A
MTARLHAARAAHRSGGGRGPWRSLRHRSMRWWSLANLVSNVGTWMQLTAQNLLVLELTGSAALTGLSVSLQAAPGLLLGLAGGAAVDAWPRKLTAAVSQALLGAVAVVTAVLIAFDQLNVGVLMALAVVTGLIATVDAPACALLGNDLVPPRDVPSAIAVGSLVHGVGRLGGAAAAGVLVSWWGPGAAYAVNGLSFLFVAAVIPFLRPAPGAVPVEPVALRAAPGRTPAEAPATERRRRRGTGARDGLVFFFRRPRLVALAAITAMSSVFGRNYTLTLAVLVTGPLAGGAAEFGAVSTVLAVGGVVGAVLAGRLTNPTVRLVGTMAAVGGLLQVAAGLSPSLAVLMALIVPMAVVESVSDTAGTTVLQTDPPPRMRGRVLGVWRSVSTGWGLVGPPLLGLLMEWAGARGALVIGGVLIAATVTAGAALRHRRPTRAATSRPAARPATAGPVPAASTAAPAATSAEVTSAPRTAPAPPFPSGHTAFPLMPSPRDGVHEARPVPTRSAHPAGTRP